MIDAAAATAPPDAGARLRLGAAGRGLDRHRQLRAAVRAVGEQRLCAGRAVAARAWRRRRGGDARRHAAAGPRAGSVRRRGDHRRGLVDGPWRRIDRAAAHACRLGRVDGPGVGRGAQLAHDAGRGAERRRSPPQAWVRCAPAWFLGDIGDLPALAIRLCAFVGREQPPAGAAAAPASTTVPERQVVAPACSIVRCRPGRQVPGATPAVADPACGAGHAADDGGAAADGGVVPCPVRGAADHGAAAPGGDVRARRCCCGGRSRAGRRAPCRSRARCCSLARRGLRWASAARIFWGCPLRRAPPGDSPGAASCGRRSGAAGRARRRWSPPSGMPR